MEAEDSGGETLDPGDLKWRPGFTVYLQGVALVWIFISLPDLKSCDNQKYAQYR